MLYDKNTANYPRLSTDVFFADYNNKYQFAGYVNKMINYIENYQLLDKNLWKRFVEQFKIDADADGGWRGEYWGKMMRGAALTYSYTRNPKLYKILSETVRDMINVGYEFGRISTYPQKNEFDAWDMWSRKYVLLGMQYFLEICEEEDLNHEIVESMCEQADYIIERIGRKEEGKKTITSCTRHWRGLNASSILEPIVRLYNITGEKRYFDFAAYIVDEGGMDIVNVFELAYENKLYPYQYPITKAYEMTSCFEGLLEFYRITKNEKYLKSIINYVNRILESDFTIIGCCGCTSEYFDHSTVRQANTNNDKVMQETCVTVTMMKFLYQLTLITGDSKYADAFETSLYNAFLGSINTEKVIEPTIKEKFPELYLEALPFDSYSPLTAGTRGNGVGGLRVMSDNHYYGCCACIGSAGCGLIPKMTLLSNDNGYVFNLYFNGEIKTKTPSGNEIIFNTETAYPANGKVKVTLNMLCDETFKILFRNPSWSKKTSLSVNGKFTKTDSGYMCIEKNWRNADVIEISFDMRTEAVYPIPYGSQILMNKPIWGHNYMISTFDEEDPKAKDHIALRRGPIVLAQDDRLGYSVDNPVSIQVNEDGYVDVEISSQILAPYENMIEVLVPLKNGKKMLVTDYASAGKLWSEENKMAAWILTE